MFDSNDEKQIEEIMKTVDDRKTSKGKKFVLRIKKVLDLNPHITSICIVLFLWGVGFVISSNFFFLKASDKIWEELEKASYIAYEETKNIDLNSSKLSDISINSHIGNINVLINKDEIEVSKNNLYKIRATIKDNELVMERENNTILRVFFNLFIGIVFAIIVLCFITFVIS